MAAGYIDVANKKLQKHENRNNMHQRSNDNGHRRKHSIEYMKTVRACNMCRNAYKTFKPFKTFKAFNNPSSPFSTFKPF